MSPTKYGIFLICGILSLVHSQAIDETIISKSKGADVAEAVVRKIQRSGIFPHDQNLLRRLAFVESRDGEDAKTFRPNYFGGIWQLDETLFNQTKNVFALNTIYQHINTTWNIQWNNVTWENLLVPLHSGLGARLFLHTLSLNNRPIPGTKDGQAEYWRTNYNRPNETNATFVDLVERLESDGGVCEGLMDICIVLDGSLSIGNASFIQAKGFVANLVQTFSLNSTRVAFVLYSNDAQRIFDFNNTLNETSMDTTIRNIIYPNANTNTPAGLEMAVTFFNQATPRPGVPKVLTTFTDGKHTRGNLTIAVSAVRQANLTSFAVGIGNEADIDDRELRQIALEDASKVFRVNDYTALAEFFYQMNKVTCEVPQEPEVGDEQNGTLTKNEKRYFKYRIPEAGFTLTLSTSRGQVSGWFSFTESTPSSALHDGRLSTSTFIPPRVGALQINSSEVFVTIHSISDGESHYKILAQEGNHVSVGFTISSNSWVFTTMIILSYFNFAN